MTDRKEKHYQRIITLSWDHPRYGYRLFQLRCVRSRVQMILAIPFLHGCSAPSGPDDRGGGDNEMRAVSINRHAEFAALVSTSPLSDSENQSGWVFRNDLSDELDGSNLDTRRWYVAGAPYFYNELPPGLTEDSDGSSVDWLGHAPSVFGMWNYFIADGKSHLLVEWEPDAEFFPVLDQEAEEIIDDVCKCRYENFTVGGVISKSNMKFYGAQWNEQEVIFYADVTKTGCITQAEAGAVRNEDYHHV